MASNRKAGDWRSIGEACEALSIHRNTVWRWIKSGKIECRPGPMTGAAGNIASKLVNLDQLRPMVGAGLKIGRPPKPKA